MIPLLKSTVCFDDIGNASVDFEVLKPDLQTTEYARFVLLYYAGILYHINPKKKGAYSPINSCSKRPNGSPARDCPTTWTSS